MSKRDQKWHILVIGYVWPEPESSAAGNRTTQLMQASQAAGWQVSFASAADPKDKFQKLQEQGITPYCVRLNDSSSFQEQLQTIRPDIVVFDRFVTEEQFGWQVKEALPACARVLDTQDLHFLRRLREQKLKEGYSLNQIQYPQLTTHHPDLLRELASIYRCDLTLVLSWFEKKLLETKIKVPSELVFWLPFAYPLSQAKKPWPAFEERQDFLSLGNFRHSPNLDAALWLKEKLWPRIREKLPQANLHLYGAYVPKKITKLHQPNQGFFVHGWCEDPYPVLSQSRVNLAPLRFGAGIKGKITDGWFAGTPNVTTSIGAEGISTQNSGWGGQIADTEEAFIESAITLYSDPSHWEASQKTGWKILRKDQNEAIHQPRWIEAIENLMTTLQERRKTSFLSALLWREQHQSSKYFSKWIELKHSHE